MTDKEFSEAIAKVMGVKSGVVVCAKVGFLRGNFSKARVFIDIIASPNQSKKICSIAKEYTGLEESSQTKATLEIS